MLIRVRQIAQSYFLAPSSPNILGIGRGLFCLALFVDILLSKRHMFADVSNVFLAPRFPLCYLGLVDNPVLAYLETALMITLSASALGIFSRFALPLSALLATYVLSYPSNFYNFTQVSGHNYNVPLIVLWILALSRSADAFSLDAIRKGAPVEPQAAYTWPIRLIWLSISIMFVAAALSKLRFGGLSWVTNEHIARLLVERHYFGISAPPVDLGLWFATHPFLCKVGGLLVICMQLCSPIFLVSPLVGKRVGRFLLLIPAAQVFFLFVVWFLMGPNFWLVIVCHIFYWPTQQQTQPQTHPRSFPPQLLILGILITLGNGIDIILARTHFPFSSYKMFAGGSRSEVLNKYVLYGVDDSGRESRLPVRPALNGFQLHGAFKALIERPDSLRSGVEDCARRYRQFFPELRAVRLYWVRWEPSVDLADLESPRRELILSVENL